MFVMRFVVCLLSRFARERGAAVYVFTTLDGPALLSLCTLCSLDTRLLCPVVPASIRPKIRSSLIVRDACVDT